MVRSNSKRKSNIRSSDRYKIATKPYTPAAKTFNDLTKKTPPSKTKAINKKSPSKLTESVKK